MSSWDLYGRPLPLQVAQLGKEIELKWPKEVKEEDVTHMIEILRSTAERLEEGLVESGHLKNLR